MDASLNHTPLRILMTTDTVGGVWSYAMELCKALNSYSVQFYLVTTGARLKPAQAQEVANLANVTVYETDFLLEWMEHPWENIDASGAWLLQLEKQLRPDLIHTNSYTYGSLPWNAPVLVVAHSDVWSWWQAVKGEQPPASWNMYYQRVRAGLQQASYLVAPSKTVMRSIREIYNIKTPGTVIYNGRSAETFHPATKENTIFSMGRIWDEAKNIRLLMEAAPDIKYPIKLAGDNSFANNQHTTAENNISYLGKLSTAQVAAALATASVYVLPAKYEPFGLSILEAALSGCALVLGAIDSLKEIWGDSAVYVDTNDAAALAQTVNNLMENDQVRINYAQKAFKQAQNYTTIAKATAYLQLYQLLRNPKTQSVQQEID